MLPEELVVRFQPGFDFDNEVVQAALQAMDATPGRSVGEYAWRIEVPPENSEALAKLLVNAHLVEYAHPSIVADHAIIPNDPNYPDQSALDLIQCADAWNITTGVNTSSVAIMDSGILASLADISSRVITGHNVLDGTTNTTDAIGHGTACASVVGATTNNSTLVSGIDWNCNLLPIKISASGSATDTDMATGIDWVRNNSTCRIINLSFAAGGTPGQALIDAIANAWTAGIMICCAAGNNDDTNQQWPANILHAIAVSACNGFNRDRRFSTTYGSWCTIAAPGNTFALNLTGGIFSFGGTSCSAPHAAGVLSLMLAANPGLSASEAVRILTDPNSSDAVGSGFGVPPAPAQVINAYKAVLACVTLPPLIKRVPKGNVMIHGAF